MTIGYDVETIIMAATRDKYFTPDDVSRHITEDDAWVSFLGRIYNITPIIKENGRDFLSIPLIKAAGTDISHWFDKTGEVKPHVDRFSHVPPPYPSSDWATDRVPWWKDTRFEVGKLSLKTRRILLINALTQDGVCLTVCSEESLSDIIDRYSAYNDNASSYTWKFEGRPLQMDKTLAENNVTDNEEEVARLYLEPELSTAHILLYYNDPIR